MSALDAARLVFLDEMSIDTAMHPRFGWAPVGKTPVIEAPRRGKRQTVLGAIAATGPIGCALLDGSLNGEWFIHLLRVEIGPFLPKNAIIVMDNLRVHDVPGVTEVLAEFGATALFLPSYSPELNPIEICWAWIKRYLRQYPKRAMKDLVSQFGRLWNAVSPSACTGWIRHCGYNVAST
jgi:transposase